MTDSTVSRVHTVDEVRAKFLLHIAGLIQYWDEVARGSSQRERLEGLAHSILVALDGNAMALPGFVVAPAPHPSDRAFSLREGENYYPEAPAVVCDIAGELHSLMYHYINIGIRGSSRAADRDDGEPAEFASERARECRETSIGPTNDET